MPPLTRGLAGGDLAGAGLEHLAHDHVVDLVAGDAGLLQRGLDRDAAEVGGGLVLEPPEQPADRRASAGDDHGSGHDGLLLSMGREPAARTDTQPPAADREGGEAPARVEQVTVPRGSRAAGARRMTGHDASSDPRRTCSSASTTSASPCPTSTRRSRSTPTPSACRSCTRRPTRTRASARRWSRSATRGTRIQLLAPLDETSTIAKFLDRSGPGPAAARLPGDRRRAGLRGAARARPAAAVRRAAPRHRRTAGSTSCTPRTPAACWSSSSSRPRPDRARELGHSRLTRLVTRR